MTLEKESLFYCLGVFSSLMLVVLVLILINWVFDIILYYKSKEKVFLSAKNVLNTYCKTMDYQQCIYETKIIFETTIVKNKELQNYYQSPLDLFKACLQAANEEGHKSNNIIATDDYKKKLIELMQVYERNNPFEKLEGTDSIVLKELAGTLEGATKELEGKQLINILSIQWEKMQNII